MTFSPSIFMEAKEAVDFIEGNSLADMVDMKEALEAVDGIRLCCFGREGGRI
jgi:hypothetical protein